MHILLNMVLDWGFHYTLKVHLCHMLLLIIILATSIHFKAKGQKGIGIGEDQGTIFSSTIAIF